MFICICQIFFKIISKIKRTNENGVIFFLVIFDIFS